MIKRTLTVAATAALFAAGLSAPVNAAPGGHAPKGFPGLVSGAKVATGNGKGARLLGLTYLYEGGGQTGLTGTAGAQSNWSVHATSLDTAAGDFHTLGEQAVKMQVGGQWQIVEVGWNVDQGLYGNTSPHLFVGSWVNGAFKGYNAAAGSGWVDYAPNATNVGATVTAGDWWQFRTQYSSTGTTGWWIWAGKWNGSAYVGDWLGYYPTSQWSSASPSVTFTSNTDVQYFWEVAANSATPCTDMGDGNLGSFGPPAVGAFVASTTNIGSAPPASTNASIAIPAGYTGYNHVLSGTTRTIRGGGPGSC